MSEIGLMPKQKIGRFDYNYKFNFEDVTLFTFKIEYYEPMTSLLETQSCDQRLARELSQIHIHNLPVPKYDKNRDIFELYTPDKNCRLYHLKDCTLQTFRYKPIDEAYAGLLIINFDKVKRKEAIKVLEEIFK